MSTKIELEKELEQWQIEFVHEYLPNVEKFKRDFYTNWRESEEANGDEPATSDEIMMMFYQRYYRIVAKDKSSDFFLYEYLKRQKNAN